MKTICGVGINDADYFVDIKGELPRVNGKRKRYQIFLCPYYSTWRTMITRCYSAKLHARQPNYADVRVCDEWHLFSTFRKWMVEQEWEGKQLDKDVLGTGKIYSPSTCVFLPRKINNFVVGDSGTSNVYPLGSGFVAKGKNFEGKSIHLGSFYFWIDARISYLKHKLSQVEHYYSSGEICSVVRDALLSRYKLQ